MGRRISGHPATAKGSGSGNEPLFNLNFKNPLTKARVAQAFSGIQQAVSSATDIAHAINDMGDKPSLRNYAALGVVVLNKILGSTTFDPNEDERFVALELMYVLKDSIAKVYSTFPGVKLIGSGDKRYQVCELGDGYMLVFSLGEGGEVSTTYMLGPEGMTEKMAIPRVRQGLWKQLGTRIEVLIPTTMLDDSMPGDLKAWKPKELFPKGVIMVKPRVEDAELFLTMKQEIDESSAKIPTRVLAAMIKRADPEGDDEDIKTFIGMNYGELMMNIAPLFGFKTDLAANLDKVKKNIVK